MDKRGGRSGRSNVRSLNYVAAVKQYLLHHTQLQKGDGGATN
jgi:hypothetical protein